MAKCFCQYHYKKPAMWQCEQCAVALCRDCYPLPPHQLNAYRCCLCQGILDYLGSANTAQPFWQRMPFFFLYPLRPTALLFLLFVTLALVWAISLFRTGFVVPLMVTLVVSAMLVRYLLKVVELLSQGTEQPPTLGDVVSGNFAITVKMIGLFYVLGFLGSRIAGLGGNYVVLAFVVTLLVLPASLMLLAMTESLLMAINPLAILSVISALGTTYFAMIAVANIILGGPALIFSQLSVAESGPNIYLVAVAVFLECYVAVIVFSIMGYILFQHQGDLGYVATHQDERVDELDPRKLALAEFSILLREGRFDDAHGAIRVASEAHPNDYDIFDRYHKFLAAIKNIPLLETLTIKFLNHLASQGNITKATDVYLKTCTVDRNFVLPSDNFRHRIGEELFRRGLNKEAFALLRSLVQDFPAYDEMDKAYFLAAKISSEGLHDDGKALKFIEMLLQHFPASTIGPEARQYRETLKTLMGNAY